jgi:hypothetical protein
MPSTKKVYVELRQFIEFCLKKFFKKLQDDPALMIDVRDIFLYFFIKKLYLFKLAVIYKNKGGFPKNTMG